MFRPDCSGVGRNRRLREVVFGLALIPSVALNVACGDAESETDLNSSLPQGEVEQAEAPLYEIPYSDTGSIAIYDDGYGGFLVKTSGRIGVDDPEAISALLASDNFVDIYAALHPGLETPRALVNLNGRYQAQRESDGSVLDFSVGSPETGSSVLDLSGESPERGGLVDKSIDTFYSTVCIRTFYNTNYKYVPEDNCNWTPYPYWVFTLTKKAGPYDWNFGWNEGSAVAGVWLYNGDGTLFRGPCSIAPYTWAHCTWTGTFSNRFGGIYTTTGRAGIDTHDRQIIPPK